MRRFFLVSILAAAISPPAIASDMRLSWDDCGAAGVSLKAFACNTNVGEDALIGSFIPPAGVDQFVGVEAVMRVYFPSGVSAVPAWWDFGGCRPSASLGFSSNLSAGPFTCADPLGPPSAGGTVWDVPYPPVGRLRVVAAIPAPHPISPDTEYYAFKVTLKRPNTAGTGACAGCDVPAAIYLDGMKLYQDSGAPEVEIGRAAPRGDHRYYATWQCEAAPLVEWDTGAVYGFTFPCAVPARPRTWGAVKSLYR